MRRVVAYVPDLMDRSRLDAAVPGSVRFARDPADLVERAAMSDVVVVDLGRPGVLDAIVEISALGVRTIGFGSHVDRELLDAARGAGCDQVLPRSAFFGQLRELLA